MLKELARIHAGGEPNSCEYRMLTHDGDVRWFMDDSAVVRDTDGYPLALYGVMIDITKQKHLEAQLAEMQRQLDASRRPRLSERELAVLRLVRDRWTDGEISKELAISERTVRRCVQDICVKLDVAKRAEMVRKARRLGVLAE